MKCKMRPTQMQQSETRLKRRRSEDHDMKRNLRTYIFFVSISQTQRPRDVQWDIFVRRSKPTPPRV